MSHARPLLETGSETERALLAAGVAERPDMASVRRAAKLVGLFPQAALVGIAFVMAIRAARWTSLAAWAALPLAGIAGVAFLAHEVGRPASVGVQTAAMPAAGAAAPSAVVPVPPVTPVESEHSARTTDSHRLPLVSPRSRARTLAAPSAVATPSARSAGVAENLRAESTLLDHARVLTASGDTQSSLALLDTYDRRSGSKALNQEALLLRIEALARSGERAAALAAAQQFVQTYPSSVHRERLAVLIHTLAR